MDESGRIVQRVFSLAFALMVFTGAHATSAKAGGGATDLSSQIQGIVSSALGAEPASSDAPATKAEYTANEAITLAENIAADAVSTASQSSPVAASALAPESAPPDARPPTGTRPARVHKAPQPRRARHRARAVPLQQDLVGTDVALASAAPRASTRAASVAPRPQRSAVPEWPRLPRPGPPLPDSSSAGQSGGQSTPLPPLLAALAGLLLAVAFGFLPRALPPSAFRKPRLVVLPPWHPG